MVRIRIADEVTDKLVDSYKKLIPQLSSSSLPPTKEELGRIIKSDASTILVAENNDDEIVGTMTLVLFRIPTGVRAWIEDVVVDSECRGEGIGKKLNQEALDIARKAGAKTVELTSRPARESANRLYQDLGFKQRETNIYRFSFE